MKKSKHSTIVAIFIIYCFFLTVILFLRNGRDFSFDFNLLTYRLSNNANFIPFETINNYISALQHGNASSTVVRSNIIGNLLLFLPMGFFLPLISKRRGFIINTVKIFIMILIAETIQLLTGLGSFDVDDLILNLTGSILGQLLLNIKENFIRKTDS